MILTKIIDNKEFIEERVNLLTIITLIKQSAEETLIKTTVD